MRAALVRDHTVLNVIEYDPDGEYDPGESISIIELSDDVVVAPSWRVTDSGFEPPAEEVSEFISQDNKQEKRIEALEAAVDQLILDQLMGG